MLADRTLFSLFTVEGLTEVHVGNYRTKIFLSPLFPLQCTLA